MEERRKLPPVMFGSPEGNFKKAIEMLQQVHESQERTIERLREENKRVTDEAYKDNELSDLKKRYEEMQKDYFRGFPISEEEEDAISKWQVEHIRKKHWDKKNNCPMSAGAIGGRFTYRFIPTSIGTIGEIVCGCGDSFTFQEL